MLADGGRIAKTQSAVVLEKLIGQFMFDKASASGSAGANERSTSHRDGVAHAQPRSLLGGAARRLCERGARGGKSPIRWSRFNRVMYEINEPIDKNLIAPAIKRRTATTRGRERYRIGDLQFLQQHRRPVLGHQRPLAGQARKGRQRFRPCGCSILTSGCSALIDIATATRAWEARQRGFRADIRHWGFPQGAYLFIPLFGPTTVRDGTGGGSCACTAGARSASYPMSPVRN